LKTAARLLRKDRQNIKEEEGNKISLCREMRGKAPSANERVGGFIEEAPTLKAEVNEGEGNVAKRSKKTFCQRLYVLVYQVESSGPGTRRRSTLRRRRSRPPRAVEKGNPVWGIDEDGKKATNLFFWGMGQNTAGRAVGGGGQGFGFLAGHKKEHETKKGLQKTVLRTSRRLPERNATERLRTCSG